jgi:hypothetical protein
LYVRRAGLDVEISGKFGPTRPLRTGRPRPGRPRLAPVRAVLVGLGRLGEQEQERAADDVHGDLRLSRVGRAPVERRQSIVDVDRVPPGADGQRPAPAGGQRGRCQDTSLPGRQVAVERVAFGAADHHHVQHPIVQVRLGRQVQVGADERHVHDLEQEVLARDVVAVDDGVNPPCALSAQIVAERPHRRCHGALGAVDASELLAFALGHQRREEAQSHAFDEVASAPGTRGQARVELRWLGIAPARDLILQVATGDPEAAGDVVGRAQGDGSHRDATTNHAAGYAADGAVTASGHDQIGRFLKGGGPLLVVRRLVTHLMAGTPNRAHDRLGVRRRVVAGPRIVNERHLHRRSTSEWAPPAIDPCTEPASGLARPGDILAPVRPCDHSPCSSR